MPRTWSTRRLIALALLVTSSAADAQQRPAGSPPLSQWHHTVWSFEGAPFQATGSTIVRSPDGYLWLGADNAIVRFDGVRFTVFDSSNTPAFRARDAEKLTPKFVDSSGAMWILGHRRATFTYQNGTFQRMSGVDSSVVIRTNSFISVAFMRDGAGQTWLADRELVTLKDGLFSKAMLPAGVPDTGVLEIVPDTGRGMWLGTATQGLWHVGENGVAHYPFADGRILPRLQTADGVLWAYNSERIRRLWRLSAGTWIRVPIIDRTGREQSLNAAALAQAPDGSVWIATRGLGVLRWHNGRLERFDESNGLSSAFVHAIWVGADGVVWLTTDAGLERLRPVPFSMLNRSRGLPFTRGEFFAHDSRGSMWAADPTTNTLYRLRGGLVAGVDGPVSVQAFRPTNDEPFKLVGVSHAGEAWISPVRGGLLRIGPSGSTRTVAMGALQSSLIFTGLTAPDGALWFTATGGNFGRLQNERYQAIPLFGLRLPWVESIVLDGRGRVWAAPEKRDEIAIVSNDLRVAYLKKTGAPGGYFEMSLEGGDTVWLHSAGMLHRAIGQDIRPVLTVGAAQYLVASSKLAVASGSVWLYNRFGLLRLPLHALHRAADNGRDTVGASIVSALDGIPRPLMPSRNDQPMVVAPDGRFWIATIDGYAVSQSSDLTTKSLPPLAHVEELSADGRSMVPGQPIRVPATPDRVTIRYTAACLSLPERVHIEYRLEGADRAWVDGSGAARVATYTQLRPGSYRFHVRAWNGDDPSDTTTAMLQFLVERAWYQSYWFYALCLVAMSTLSYLMALAMSRKRNQQAAERAENRFKAVLEERTRIARELHDTLLQGFTGITLHLETVRHQLAQRSDPTAAELAQALQFADGTLREAREMVWDMRAPELNEGLIHAIAAESHRVINGDKIRLAFSTSGTERRLAPALETTLLRVAREAVANAVKHADPQAISISLDFATRRVTLTIRDDGRGADPHAIERARTSGHWGLTGMQERATRVGGTFDMQTEPGHGMVISLSLPTDQ